jgi:serine/threonine-protein kinase
MSQAASPTTTPAAAPEESLEGTVVGGKYRVGKLIGHGGMGTVWLGMHLVLNTRVAIKFIRPQFAERPDARRRFEIEARAAANVKSKHAVQIFDYGVTESGLPYIVMEYLEGESLSETLVRRGPLPADEAARVIGQAARALQKAHDAGIIHRDLKPDNIFLATNVENAESDLPYTVKLVDFGIAKMLDVGTDGPTPLGGPTQDGAVIGTPNFMSPEQLTVGGAPGPLTDVWSLGACTYAAFTARIPFEGEVLGDIVLKVCIAPLPLPSEHNPQVPPGLDAWFARACNRDPTKRFQSATELSEALNNVCGLGRIQVATYQEDQVRYELKPQQPDINLDDLPSGGMSPKTALLAGLVLGITCMVGVAGALAWREATNNPDPTSTSPTPTTTVSAGAVDAGAKKP